MPDSYKFFRRHIVFNRNHLTVVSLLLAASSLLFGESAEAIPSFARQTGAACSTCHTNSFGPNLTPFGRTFKLKGYTMGGDSGGLPPLSAMVMGSFYDGPRNLDKSLD